MATSVSVICEAYFKSLNAISVSNSTPVVSVTLCDASNGAEFDGLSGQKLETKEDLHPLLMKTLNGLRCATGKVMRLTITSRDPF